jgi:hypothetical protein
MKIKRNLKLGEFPTCKKCIFGDNLSLSNGTVCHLPKSDKYRMDHYCSQGMWKSYDKRWPYYKTHGPIIDFIKAYSIWDDVAQEKIARRKQTDRRHDILFLDFSYLQLRD